MKKLWYKDVLWFKDARNRNFVNVAFQEKFHCQKWPLFLHKGCLGILLKGKNHVLKEFDFCPILTKFAQKVTLSLPNWRQIP